MRYLIAVLIAFAVMGLDFEKITRASTVDSDHFEDAAPLADRFASFDIASVDAPEFPKIADPVAVSASEVQVESAGESAEPSAKDFCEALKDAAEAGEIPVAFFARLLW